MPVTWTSPGNSSTARPGSGGADRPDAIPSASPGRSRPVTQPDRAKSIRSARLPCALG